MSDWFEIISIVTDRYTGVYSGGEWIAYYGRSDRTDEGGDLEDAYAGDLETALFWESQLAAEIGRGNSPQQALVDLERRRKAQGKG